jgi:secreted Zn-dependent insulinase-like peptidase
LPDFVKSEELTFPKALVSQRGQKVWFKADDQFEQPYLQTRVIFRTIDCGFSLDPRMNAVFMLWEYAFKHSLQEELYQAELANINFDIGGFDSTFGLVFISHNQGYDKIYSKVFNAIKNFEPDEQIIEEKRQSIVRALHNRKIAEPV